MNLLLIGVDGLPADGRFDWPPIVDAIGQSYKDLYEGAGFSPPWCGYLAMDDGVCVGTCGFKGPPRGNAVEIAYFTFPEFEGKGYAREMARNLVALARHENPELQVVAQTLPQENASTSVLRHNGFEYDGERIHEDDGIVWEWKLPLQGDNSRDLPAS